MNYSNNILQYSTPGRHFQMVWLILGKSSRTLLQNVLETQGDESIIKGRIMAIESDNPPASDSEKSVAFIVVTEPVEPDQTGKEQAAHSGLPARYLDYMLALCVEYSGHPVSTTAHGSQVIFPSAEQSLLWALAIQKDAQQTPAEERIEQKMGIHQGEVFIDGKVLQGPGLEVALLLKSKAPAGGVCISSTVVQLIANPSQFPFQELSDWDATFSEALPKRAYLIQTGTPVKKKEERTSDSTLQWICLIGFSASAFVALLIIRNHLTSGFGLTSSVFHGR